MTKVIMLGSSLLFRILRRLGIGVYRHSEKSKVIEALSMFRPVDVGVQLVRIGPETDGGYLLPRDFESIKYLYSPGVDTTADFDYAFAEMGATCFLLDYSVDTPPVDHSNFVFSKKFLGPVSHGNYVSLSDWIMENEDNESDLLLQMDIEGAEWAVLANTPSQVLKRFRIMVVEFHDLAARIANPNTCEAVTTLLTRLREDFSIVHLHPNNCGTEIYVRGLPIPPVIEVTFLRKDREVREPSAVTIPHELDRPNRPGDREPRVPMVWM